MSVGLGAAVGFLLAALVKESVELFNLENVMTETNRYVVTALNTTRGKLHSFLQPSTWKPSDDIATFSPPACTADQLDLIFQRLPEIRENCVLQGGRCPITFLTSCPRTTWLDEYYNALHEQKLNKKSFLAIQVGCNEGYDAVRLLRMGSNKPDFTRQTWKDALPQQDGAKSDKCDRDAESEMPLSSSDSSSDALVYCIEPMPRTFLALQNASLHTGWGDKTNTNQLKVLQVALNNQDPSTVPFPSAAQAEFYGLQVFGMSNACAGKSDECVPVQTKRLDLMMREERLTNKRVNALLIDVEGFDFEILQGGKSTLENTEYIEFELDGVGQVRS